MSPNTNWDRREGIGHDTIGWQKHRAGNPDAPPPAAPCVYVQDADFTLHLGDVRDVLPTLEADSVDCVATSPPFYGLRDYGTGSWVGGDPGCDHKAPPTGGPNPERYTSGGGEMFRAANDKSYRDVCGKCGAQRTDRQIGLEATPDLWVETLVGVFRDCHRVLRPSGTLWIECSDSYANGPASGTAGQWNGSSPLGANRNAEESVKAGRQVKRPTGMKPKDLIGAPWLLAFALRADGWYLRQCLIWAKPNCMPESATDRCTTAHSYVFLFSRKPRYWFDADAIAEPYQPSPEHAWRYRYPRYAAGNGQTKGPGDGKPDFLNEPGGYFPEIGPNGQRNARSVWTIPTQGYPDAHFATWPEALAERIIKAGCPEWVCGVCGKPRERIQEVTYTPHGNPAQHNAEERVKGADPGGNRIGRLDGASGLKSGPQGMKHGRATKNSETVGWSDCGHGSYRPGVILDPFMGSGTTALVARRLGRASVGVELNEQYAAMCARRLQQLSLLAEPV